MYNEGGVLDRNNMKASGMIMAVRDGRTKSLIAACR